MILQAYINHQNPVYNLCFLS